MPRDITPADFPSFLDIVKTETKSGFQQCIFLTQKKFERCKNVSFAAERQKSQFLRQKIQICSTAEQIGDLLREYIPTLGCAGVRHNERLRDPSCLDGLVRRWQRELAMTLPNVDGPAEPTTAAPPLTTFQSPTRSYQSTPRTPTSRATRQSSRLNSTPVSQSTNAFDATTLPTPIAPKSDFQLYKTEFKNEIPSVLRTNISDTDLNHTGIIYTYTRSSDPGMVKIGLTTNPTVVPRLLAWQRKCGYKPELLHYVSNVPHLSRTERLIHHELGDQRRRETRCNHGTGCSTQHKEWFEVDTDTAIPVIDAWTRWMKTNPYDANGSLNIRWSRVLLEFDDDNEPITGQALVDMIPHLSEYSESRRTSLTSRASRPSLTRPTTGPLVEETNDTLLLFLALSMMPLMFAAQQMLSQNTTSRRSHRFHPIAIAT